MRALAITARRETEKLGWKIYRVWSTDWFKSRDVEIRRLLSKIQDLLASDPADAREKEKTQNVK